VLVVREFGELGDVVPHTFVGSVEEVGAVLMYFNAGFWFGLGERVTANMGAFFNDEDALAKLAGGTFSNG